MLPYLNPLNWFRWIGQFVLAWLLDTEWRRTATAVPSVVVLLVLATASALTWSRSEDWRKRMVEDKLAEAVQREDFEVVDLLLRRRLRDDPENRNLRFRLGLLRESRDQHEQAAEIFKGLVAEHGDAEAALWLLTHDVDMAEAKNWDRQQLAEFGHWTSLAIRENPDHLRANAAHAEYLIARGDASKAVPYLIKLARAEPAFGLRAAVILRGSGQESSAQWQAEEALARLADQLADDPQNSRLRILHAQLLVFLKRYPEAVSTLSEAVQRSENEGLRPAIAEALLLWAHSLGDDPEEIAVLRQRLQLLQKAAELAPAHPAVLDAITSTVLATVDQDDAQVAALRESLIAGSSPGMSHFIRGTTLMLQDKPEDAAVHLQLAAKQLPQTPAILNNLAVALAAKPGADLEQPLKLVEQAIERAATSPGGPAQLPYFYETRGQILLKSERYLDAIADLEKALAVPKLRTQAHQGLARAYQGLGQTELADSHQAQAEENR